MTQTLEDAVQFSKSVGKLVKKELKSLYKDAKEERKYHERSKKEAEETEEEETMGLSVDDAKRRLEEVLPLFARHVDTAATRDFAEAEMRTSVAVEGETLLEDVPVRLLLPLRKKLKRLYKAADVLADTYEDPEFVELLTRAGKLREAVEQALKSANETEVEAREVSATLLGYLSGGPDEELEPEAVLEGETVLEGEAQSDVESGSLPS